MESAIVIKVKYGETLRRFNAHVSEAGQLDFDIGALKEKVASLFNFAPDADLTLTYVDEDGDNVTLVDEEDLFDVMRQSLNPLRITVQLNAEKGGRFYARSSGNSTPMRSPRARVRHQLPNLNNGVPEILRSVPEPVRDGVSEIWRSVPETVREVLSKVSQDLASKAAPSASGLADIVDYLSKVAQPCTNTVSEFQAGTESSMQERASGGAGGAAGASMGKVSDASGSDGSMLQGITNAIFEDANSKACQKGDVVSGTKGVDALVNPASGSLNLNTNPPDNSFPSGTVPVNHSPVTSQDNTTSKHEVKKSGECHFSEKAGKPPVWIYPKGAPPADYKKDFSMCCDGWKFFPAGAASPGTADNMKSPTMDSKAKNVVFNSSSKFPAPNLVGKCLANDAVSPFTHFGPRVHPFKRSYNHGDGMSSIFHRGVRCDGCGVHPITGPRFKSIVKDDYDLCSICFSVMGNEADYIRMDRPVSHQHRHNYKGVGDSSHRRMRLPVPLVRDCMMKPGRAKLDSRFIVDVNVPDGAVMAPRTQFTKIWRMRNNGTTAWPQGTQLVWNGGDKLSDSLSVELQVSVDGIPVENELDVAVDFTAPYLPGRYVSYWRMASPSGQKFGQRVWVLIQVDASVKDTLCNSFQGLNLNLPPESHDGITGPETMNGNVELVLVEGSLPGPNISDKASELVEPLVVGQLSDDPEMNFPINDSLLVNGSVSNSVPPEAPTVAPIVDLSEAAPTLPSHAPSLSVGLTANVQVANENPDVEQTLLKELEEMGFKQVNLNKEILRLNEYDLEQSVDDLCGVAEWDPMLEELQEMGFCDKEMNRKLLKKNNGSIKRVVMDLIYGEKP